MGTLSREAEDTDIGSLRPRLFGPVAASAMVRRRGPEQEGAGGQEGIWRVWGSLGSRGCRCHCCAGRAAEPSSRFPGLCGVP